MILQYVFRVFRTFWGIKSVPERKRKKESSLFGEGGSSFCWSKTRLGRKKNPRGPPGKFLFSRGADFIPQKVRKTLKTLCKIIYFAISEKVALGAWTHWPRQSAEQEGFARLVRGSPLWNLPLTRRSLLGGVEARLVFQNAPWGSQSEPWETHFGIQNTTWAA